MSTRIGRTVTTPELAELIDLHLSGSETDIKNPSWRILDSSISGRGIFAARDIEESEIIFRERALLAGPTGHKNSKLNTCCVCYCQLSGNDTDILCKLGCSMPVCENCSTSDRHRRECETFRQWKPKDLSKVNPHSLRIVTVMRCIFLNEEQSKLLISLQANGDKYYRAEVQRAAACFECFPKNPQILEWFYRTICVLNTNAFEGRSNVGNHEVFVRALFPLAGLMNHRCVPNATHSFENGETIVVRAAKSIARGEEIVTTYAHILWSNLARKMFLGLTKHFMCQCQRCLDPTVSIIKLHIDEIPLINIKLHFKLFRQNVSTIFLCICENGFFELNRKSLTLNPRMEERASNSKICRNYHYAIWDSTIPSSFENYIYTLHGSIQVTSLKCYIVYMNTTNYESSLIRDKMLVNHPTLTHSSKKRKDEA
uniref:SET domain-containing protein n=1 Tax=Glossina pallidipes TaxID=7398 RepID=A0A1A9ZB77_GLOPL